jgi:N-acetylglucosamine malate deacetylase 2
MKETVLAIYPHPDDETFGKAGALALHAKKGSKITLICATMGQMGRRMGNPFFANRETLPLIREKELREACRIIGIQDIRLWRLQDKMLQFEDPMVLADRIFQVVDEVKPTIIYTYYPEHGVHADHDALSKATILAISRIPKDKRPTIYGSAFSKNCLEVLGKPDIKLDVSKVIDIKLNAVKAHHSQSEGITRKLEKEMADHPEKKEEYLLRNKTESYWTYRWKD